MIKFFRKIRHRLLTENKISKYLLYAIGEIVLVMIGILLALSINNWNQTRQDNHKINSYLHKIGNELNTDFHNLELMIERRKQALIYTDTILKYYKKNHIEDSKLFENGFRSLFFESRFFPNTRAYESFKNSGHIKDLKNPEIEDKLNQYYHQVDNLLFIENGFNSITLPAEHTLGEKGFYIEYQDILKWNNKDTVRFTIESMQKYPEFHTTFLRAKVFLEQLIELYYGLLENSQSTIELVDNEG